MRLPSLIITLILTSHSWSQNYSLILNCVDTISSNQFSINARGTLIADSVDRIEFDVLNNDSTFSIFFSAFHDFQSNSSTIQNFVLNQSENSFNGFLTLVNSTNYLLRTRSYKNGVLRDDILVPLYIQY
jgi:hypothetical protein